MRIFRPVNGVEGRYDSSGFQWLSGGVWRDLRKTQAAGTGGRGGGQEAAIQTIENEMAADVSKATSVL